MSNGRPNIGRMLLNGIHRSVSFPCLPVTTEPTSSTTVLNTKAKPAMPSKPATNKATEAMTDPIDTT